MNNIVKIQEDKLTQGSFSFVKKILGNFSTDSQETQSGVKIKVLNESIYFGSAKRKENGPITVVYDKQNLDSLYGLSFFMFIYGDQIQPIDYHNGFVHPDLLRTSEQTIILGVEINEDDLLFLNSQTKETKIYSYKGSFDYLYDKKQQALFNNITLYRGDDDFYIGGKNIEQLENTVAMMLKISYFYTYEWRNWPQSKHAMEVAHYTSFFPNVEEYKLTKSIFKDEAIQLDKDVTLKRAIIDTSRESLMWDLRTKFESSLLFDSKDIANVIPENKPIEYKVYKNRLEEHIKKSRRLFGLRNKSFLDSKSYPAYYVPAVGFAIHDIITISSKNVNTTICVENFSHTFVYHVYSTIKGRAELVAKLLDGEKTWMQGNVICVMKIKENKGSYE